MKGQDRLAASRDEIFAHLGKLNGQGAKEVIAQAMEGIAGGKVDKAIATLKAYDATLGGVSMPDVMGKPPGAYRALGYIEFYLRNPYPAEMSRAIISAACSHIESILKRMVRLGLIERGRDDIPLGKLLEKAKRKLPQD